MKHLGMFERSRMDIIRWLQLISKSYNRINPKLTAPVEFIRSKMRKVSRTASFSSDECRFRFGKIDAGFILTFSNYPYANSYGYCY